MAFSLEDFLMRNGTGVASPDMNGIGDLLRANAGGIGSSVPVEHKGIFGVKGRTRDFLGALFDAMATGFGGKAVYQPGRDQELIGDAVNQYGFGSPEAMQAIAAINPQLAQQMYNQQEMADYRREGLGIRARGMDARVGNINTKTDEINRKRAGSMITAGIPKEVVAQAYPQFAGDIADLEGEQLNRWATGNSMDTNQQVQANATQQKITNQADQFKQTLPIKQQTADAATTRAGASVTSAGASASRASTAASVAPSQVRRNDASAAYDNKRAGTGGGGGMATPPMDPKQFKGKTASDGTNRWYSDGVKWIKK